MEDIGGISDMGECWRQKQENRPMEQRKELSPKRKISSNANNSRDKIPKLEVDPLKLISSVGMDSQPWLVATAMGLMNSVEADPVFAGTSPGSDVDTHVIAYNGPRCFDNIVLETPVKKINYLDTVMLSSDGEDTLPQRREFTSNVCTDWCVVSGGCHYARDKAWFKTYRPLSSLAAGMIVKGVGTVELPVRTNPQDPSQTRKIIMKDVLHIPEAICNGFQPAFSGVGSITYGQAGAGMVGRDDDDNICFYAEAPLSRFGPELVRRVPQLVLAECVPRGVSFLNHGPSVAYMLSIHLSDEEEDALFPPRRAVTYV